MKAMDLADLLEAMGACWPNFAAPTGDRALGVWLNLLADISPEEAVAAVSSLARDGERFAPPPGLIAKRAIENRGDEVTWGEQWRDFMFHISRGSRSVDAEDPAVCELSERLIPMAGGLEHLAMNTTEDDWPVLEAQTREKWKALRARDLADHLYAPIGTPLPRLAAARKRIEGTDFVRIGDALGER